MSMPRVRAASSTYDPSSTSIGWPSIVIRTFIVVVLLCRRCYGSRGWLPAFFRLLLNLVTFAALHAFDTGVSANLVAGATLDAFILNDPMQFLGFANNCVGRARFHTGVAAGA